MTNRFKKIIAVATIVSSLMMAAGPALAITAAELQAQIDALMAQLATLQSQLAELEGEEPTVSGCTITSFDRALSQGMSGDDVKCLQIVLNSAADTQLAESGVGSSGEETSYFGPLTKAAVIKFQEKYAEDVLASWGLTEGTGYVGSTTRTKLNSMLVGGVVPSPDAPTANVVSLAADTPGASVVARGAQDVEFTRVKFTAGSEAYTVTAIAVTRSGVSADTDVSNMKLYDGTTRVGSTQAVNTVTHKAVFSNLSWVVPANTVKYLTIKGSIYSVAAISNSIVLGIASLSDITTAATLGGTFPMNGNAKTVATQAVGTFTVNMLATPAASTPISGSVEQQVGTLQLSAASEAFDVNSIKFTQVGTAGDADVSNVKIKYGATLLGTIADVTNAAVTLTGSPIINIPTGASRNLDIYVDVAGGIKTSRTIIWEITQAADVIAVGSQSGGAVIPVAATAFPEQTATHVISQGSLVIALNAATNPSSQNYVIGTAGNKMLALKFSAGSTEGVRVTQLTLTLGGTAAATDVSNIALYDGDTLIAGPSGISGSTVQFGVNTINAFDVPGLFDVAASANKVITVKSDISAGATANATATLGVALATHVKADGLASEMDLPSGISLSGTPTGNAHTVTSYGTLAVSLNSLSPAAQTVPTGITGKEVAKYNLIAGSGEDIIVSSIILKLWKDAAGTTTPCVAGDVTNISLWDGTTQLGVTVSAPIASASFNANLTVAAGATKILTAKVDIPTGTTAGSIHVDLDGTASGNMISTGASSLATIVESGTAVGKLMTVGTPSIAVVAASTPVAAPRVTNTGGVTIANLILTAGTAEDVKVSYVQVSFDATDTLAAASAASAQFANVKLMEGTTQHGTTKQITDATPDNVEFSGMETLSIAAGQAKQLSVVVDIVGTSAGPWYAGHLANADVMGAGVTSGSSINSSGGVQSSAGLTIASSGALAVSVDANTPSSANVAVGLIGTTDVAFSKIKFTPTIESVKLSRVKLTRSGGADTNFAAAYLYDGTTKLGTAYMSSNAVTFNFSPGNEIIIPFGGEKVITAKADLTGVGTGVTHAHAPILYVASTTADIDSVGYDSQTAIVESGTGPMTASNFGAMTLYKTTASIALNSGSPSGSALPGATQQLLKVDITNNGLYDLTVDSFDVTPSWSGTIASTTTNFTKLYWSTDLSTVVATSTNVGTIGSGNKITITPASNNTVGPGATRTLVVVGDTTGLVATNTFRMDLAAMADFGWNPAAGGEVTSLTTGMPLTGGTLTY